MIHIELPGCTCRAAGDPAAYMHDEGCPARDNAPVCVGQGRRPVISGAPALSRRPRNAIRAERVRAELARLDADDPVRGVLAASGNRGVRLMGPDGIDVRWVDGLAALGLLIELPDGAGTQTAWAALLTLPEIT